jgi:integrase
MPAITWELLGEKIDALYEPPLAQPPTRRQVRQAWRELTALGPKKSSDLDEQLVARWVVAHAHDPGRGPARQESLLRVIRRFANYAVRRGYLRVSPFAIKPFKTWINAAAHRRRKRVRYKSGDEIRRMLHVVDRKAALFYQQERWRVSDPGWADGRGQALLYVYVYTGLRRNEALHILARNVDLENGMLTIEPVGNWRPKTVGSGRVIPLAQPVIEVLRQWLPRCGANLVLRDGVESGRIWLFPGRRLKSPWRGAQNYKPIDYIRGIAELAGVGDMTIIGFRKSLGTNAKAMGLGGLERKELLGHSYEKTGDWYDDDRVETMRPAVAKIVSFYAPPPAPAQTQSPAPPAPPAAALA